MEAHNNGDVAAFFRQMAVIEGRHVEHVRGLQIAASLNAGERWDDIGGREAPDWAELHYKHTPCHAISLAICFEQKAARFFADVARTAPGADLRRMAEEMGREEEQHIHELRELLQRYAEPDGSWDFDPDPPIDAE